jgi:hypothetical protein
LFGTVIEVSVAEVLVYHMVEDNILTRTVYTIKKR